MIASILVVLTGVVVWADDAPSVKISLIQTAGVAATHERIDVINDSTAPVDMTDWRLVYWSATGGTSTTLVRFRAVAPTVHLMLPEGQSETIVSKELAATAPLGPLASAWQFTGGLSSSGGSVQLVDPTDRVVDMVGWGASTNRAVVMGDPAPSVSSTTWLIRRGAVGNNALDFETGLQSVTIPMRIGSMIEMVDVCLNLPGLQQSVPDGYVGDSGTCQLIDRCPNLVGLQSDLPTGLEYDGAGNCVPIDVCANITGLQAEVPIGYELTGARTCELLLPVRRLVISELLPNPSGADAGNEFIELFNDDTEPAELDNYRLGIGDKLYKLPAGAVIAPGAYWTVSDIELGVSLPNTTGPAVYLVTMRGLEVASAPAYKNAPDDVSWSRGVDGWQFSYVPTPGQANVMMVEEACQQGYVRDIDTHRCRKLPAPVVAIPCTDGQYRNEATGRCRATSPASVLVPCKEGQYRSEETGRCRALASLAASVVKPCPDDQFRNPLTNRCKSIASSDDVSLTDCGEGRERNPETHRCRNVVSTTVPAATFAVAPMKEAAKGFVGWWALGGVGLLAAGYGAWEWRRELARLLERAGAFIGRRP